MIENHVKTYFEETGKNMRVDKITANVVDQYYKYLRDIRTKRLPKGMGANTIRKHYTYLNQLFDYALKHTDVYGIQINPVKNSTPPKKKKPVTPSLKPYTMSKIAELVKTVQSNNDLPLECAVMIGLFCGTRRGETDYIKWSDLDFELGSIAINGCRTCSNVEVIKLLRVIPLTDVSEHLGHSNTDITAKTYAHKISDEKNEVADGLDNEKQKYCCR